MKKYMDMISNSTTDPKPTVYISGAISGVDAVIARAEFSLAEEEAKKLFPNHSVFNPYKVGAALPGEWTYEQIMNLDLAVLEDCDAIYMMDGWQASKGATIEYKFAKENDIEIVYQKDYEKELEQRAERPFYFNRNSEVDR